MTPEQAVREDMMKMYPGATVTVQHVNMNYFEATVGQAHHAYLVIDGKAVRQG